MRTEAFQSNMLETANMALGIVRILDKIGSHGGIPEGCESILSKGISFVDEAKGGMATITGSTRQADSFHGSFGPSSLVTDVCIVFKDKCTKDLEDRLNRYRDLLTNLHSGSSDVDSSIVPEMESFFEAIFDILTMNEDPTVSSYSQPFCR